MRLWQQPSVSAILHPFGDDCNLPPLPSLPDLELGSSALIAGCLIKGWDVAGEPGQGPVPEKCLLTGELEQSLHRQIHVKICKERIKTSWKLVCPKHLCTRCKAFVHPGVKAVGLFLIPKELAVLLLLWVSLLCRDTTGVGNGTALPAQTSLKKFLCSLAGSFPRNTHQVAAYPVTGSGKQQYEMSDRACQGLSAWEGFHWFSWASAPHPVEASLGGGSISREKGRQGICHHYCLKKILWIAGTFTAWLWGRHQISNLGRSQVGKLY